MRFFLGALLVLVSLSMLTYLIPSYNSGGSSDMIVAQIGKDTITVPEVQQTVQASLRGRNLPPELMPHYVPQVIDSMITDRALAYEAMRLGFQVTDQQLADAIRSLLPSLFPDGKFAGTDAYAALLAQQNMTIEQFEATLKRQLLVTRLRDIALEGTVVSPLLIEQEFRNRNDKAKIEYVKISADKLRSEVQVTPQEMENYYNTSKATFQVPEKKTLGILIVDQEKVAQSITPTDAELQRMYDQNKDRFRTPERVKVRHILLTTTGKSPQEEAAIKAKAEDLLKQVKAGANFADLARKYSNDPGSASKGGDLDWIVRGQTVPEFEQAAFSLKPGETSNLIKTQYGYHIIQVLAKEPAHLKTFEEVKNELATEYKNQQVNQRMQSLSDNVEAGLKKNPLHPEQVAAALGVEFVQADKIASGDPIPAVG
ncbi:MAG: peptidylprolyl isomerase, partial [Acidobacteria bacterium]|nr:peptidylprolyl isomerase [Acidobacteriota bacterium]